MPQELQIPPNAASDSNAAELIRAWASGGSLVCNLNPTAWPEDQAPVACGVRLADVARLVADALQQSDGLEKSAVLARMRSVIDGALDRPTAETIGRFV
jgi:hypothetical protein